MLFMAIFSFEPEQRNEVLKKRAAKGSFVPEGATIHGQWSSISGGQVFTLLEVDDPLVGILCFQDYTSLGKVELVPVMDTEKQFKALAAMR